MIFSINLSSFFLRVLALTFVFQISLSWSEQSKRILITDMDTELQRRYWIYLDDISSLYSSDNLGSDFYITADNDNVDQIIPDEVKNLFNVVDVDNNYSLEGEMDNKDSLLENPLNLLHSLQDGCMEMRMHGAPIFMSSIFPEIIELEFSHQLDSSEQITMVSPQTGSLTEILSNNELVSLRGSLLSGAPFELSEAVYITNEKDQKELSELRQSRKRSRPQNIFDEELSQLGGKRMRLQE